LKTVNASGGINGHPVDLIVKDDAGNPSAAVTAFQALRSDGVVAIEEDDLVDQAWSSRAAAAKIPVIGGLVGTQTQGALKFPAGSTDDVQLAQTVNLAKEAGTNKIGDLYCAESPTCAQGYAALKPAAAAAGISIAYATAISATAPNYTAQCLAARQAGVDFLTVGSQPSVIVHAISDCAAQGFRPDVSIAGASWNHTQASLPGLSDLTIYQVYDDLPFFVDTNPQIKALNAAYEKYYPGQRNNQAVPEESLVGGWASGMLLQKAVELTKVAAGKPVTSGEIIQALYTFKGETLDGLAPPLTFTPGHVQSVRCWFTAEIVHGSAKILNDGKTTCAK